MLVSSWLLFTKLKKLRFRKNEHFRTVSNVRKQKNAQNWRLRFRFRRRQAMALGHSLSETKTETSLKKKSVSAFCAFLIAYRLQKQN